MPYFDRFDICGAYMALEWDYNMGGILWDRPSCSRREESVGVQLARIGFRVGMGFRGWGSLSENAQEIYMDAVRRLDLPCPATLRGEP